MKAWLKGGLIGAVLGLVFAIIFAPIFGQILNCMLFGMPCDAGYISQRSVVEILFTFKNPDHIGENWIPWIFIGLFMGLIMGWIIEKIKSKK
tara:strand:+ start:809 stop:1084 length:276 start_codon:yes stop_codon:yes gene_type:complete